MTRILLIEDNEMNRDMLSRRLGRRGYEVVTASDGREGVEMAASQTPDIILMDLSLPEIDGLKATRIIKADSLTAGIPVIALTAHALESDRDRALGSGCDDYDTKPVVFDRLISKIENCLNR